MSQTPLQQQAQLLPLSSKRFWFPLLLQTALILVVPAQAWYTQVTGKTVFLQTLPVDPYDFLRGYSQTLSYEISRVDRLQQLPGWQELSQQKTLNSAPFKAGTRFYVILAAPAFESQPPQAWKPIKVSSQLPDTLPANQIAIEGKSTGGRIEYGLETYYMPESQSQEVNQDINRVQQDMQRQPVIVEVKVDAQGRAVPISLWVSKRNYRF
jgi:uncharacterized membrane-anchored protein